MDVVSSFNMILGRPSLNMFHAVESTYHMKIKFPVNDPVGEIISDRAGYYVSFHYRPCIDQINLAGQVTRPGRVMIWLGVL